MRNIREAAENIVIIGGLLTTGVSAVDAMRIADVQHKEIQTISDELREEYGVFREEHCLPVGLFGGNPSISCSERLFVPNASSAEDADRLIRAYEEEFEERKLEIPLTREESERAARDAGGMLAGTALTIAGFASQEMRKLKK